MKEGLSVVLLDSLALAIIIEILFFLQIDIRLGHNSVSIKIHIRGLIKLMNLLVVNNQSSGKYVCSKFFFVGIMPLEEEVLVVIRKFSSGNFLDKLLYKLIAALVSPTEDA
jgi:hypothetical protein